MSLYGYRSRYRRRDRETPHASITLSEDGGLEFSSSYNKDLVWNLKESIPRICRKWDGGKKVWVVAAEYGDVLIRLSEEHLGIRPGLPDEGLDKSATQVEETLKVEYIGRAKIRDDGTESATGWANDGWNVIFDASVLKKWFGYEDSPAHAGSLFAALGVSRAATQNDIRKAHRRAAKQWHPDVCSEPDAAEQFQRIQSAYEILSDDHKRARYLAGLILQERTEPGSQYHNEFAPPLRCGHITVKASLILGRYDVKGILAWEDITDSLGRTMVSSWRRGATHFSVTWS